jgi:hypothetical protein
MINRAPKLLSKAADRDDAPEVHVGADASVRVGALSAYGVTMPILGGVIGGGMALLFFTHEKTGPSIPALAVGLIGGALTGYLLQRDTLTA